MKILSFRNRNGSALIFVLSILVLLTAIVVTLLFRVQTDLSLSQNYAGQTSVKTLSDTAVNLVIAQIRSGSSNQGQAWISQPGLIRTFNNSGNPVAAYKLYSSNVMTDTTGTFNPNTDAAALANDSSVSGTTGDWSNYPNIFVDLNSPIMINAGTGTAAVFPSWTAIT